MGHPDFTIRQRGTGGHPDSANSMSGDTQVLPILGGVHPDFANINY